MPLRTEMTVRSDNEILLAAIDKRIRPASASFDNLGAGWHVGLIAVRMTVKPDDAQMDTTEGLITALPGITATKFMVLGPDSGVPAVPGTHRIDLLAEMRYQVVELP